MRNPKDFAQSKVDKVDKVVNSGAGMLSQLDTATSKFRNRRGSIVSAAKSNIFEFPVFVSSSVPLDYATATNSLLEQVYASYLQMAISVNPVVSHTLVSNGLQFAHLKSDTGKYLEYTDEFWQHDCCHNEFVNEDCHYEFDMITVSDTDNNAIVEYVNHQPLSEFEHFFTEARVTKKDLQDEIDALNKKMNNDGKRVQKAIKEHRKAEEDAKNKAANFSKALAKIDNVNAREKELLGKQKDAYEKNLEAMGREKDIMKRQHDEEIKKLTDARKTPTSASPKFIGEKDIDKLNTMRPLLMSTKINSEASDGTLTPVEYVIGVKTFCRLIDADTIPEVAEYPLKEMNKVVRKAKWRAGELKFFSDIVFRIKQKKQTAIDSRDPKRKWYRRLYELAHMKGDAPTTEIVKGNSILASFVFDKMGQPRSAHGVIPNCTMVISKTDVDICKMKTDIDLLDGKTASHFCNELYLIGIVVIDTDQESIKLLLPDMHDDYDVHSLASVNRQMAQLDFNSVKQKEFNKFIK